LENASFEQVRQLAEKGDPVAQNALGLRYFQGDDRAGVKLDEKEAVHWFTSAAEHGNVAAQSKLGFLYWSGRGIPKDLTKAYMWTLIACGQGEKVKDPAVFLSKDLAQVLRSQMTRDQAAAIEHQAQQWRPRNSSSSSLAAAR
jgi:TPR repeat protein